MILKIKYYLKKQIKYIAIILQFFIILFRRLRNYLKILISKNTNDFYIPNFGIKNLIFINPNKIELVNSIPMKFNKSTRFILDFNWDELNKNLATYSHPTYVTCHEIFVEGKELNKTKNFLDFKNKIIEKKIYKNCKNENDVINFLKKKIKMFNSIKKLGVKKNFLTNIQFMIDKNFNLVKINSGNHRMAMSRILKIKKIPIEIKIIHSHCFGQSKVNLNKINQIIRDIELRYN